MHSFDPKTTALVLIDLQKGIVGLNLAPRSGDEVVETSKALATRFREAGAPVVLVHVEFSPGDIPPQDVDAPTPLHNLPPDWPHFVEGLRHPGDIAVVKHHWGAFTGTDLDLQLRRRGIRTIVFGGIATNFGVESTARSAWEHSYNVAIVEDACASVSAELHDFAVTRIFPRISHVLTADRIELSGSTKVQPLA